MKSAVILAKCLCVSVTLRMFLFALEKWKWVTTLMTCCWSHIYCWSFLIWDSCYWDFTCENCGGKIRVQQDDLRKRASLVIALCLPCIPAAMLCHWVVIIRLFRVILKLNHCSDMPVMPPDAAAQQFRPQRKFSGWFLDCSGVISDLFQITGVAPYYMTRSLLFWFVHDLFIWE